MSRFRKGLLMTGSAGYGGRERPPPASNQSQMVARQLELSNDGGWADSMKQGSRHDDQRGTALGLVCQWDLVPAVNEYIEFDLDQSQAGRTGRGHRQDASRCAEAFGGPLSLHRAAEPIS